VKENHTLRGGVSAKKRGGNRGFHVERRDLTENDRLCRLYFRAVELRLLTAAESDVVFCFAAAEHALRCGNDPPAMFVATLRDRNRLGPNVAEEDGDAAARRLRAVRRSAQ